MDTHSEVRGITQEIRRSRAVRCLLTALRKDVSDNAVSGCADGLSRRRVDGRGGTDGDEVILVHRNGGGGIRRGTHGGRMGLVRVGCVGKGGGG